MQKNLKYYLVIFILLFTACSDNAIKLEFLEKQGTLCELDPVTLLFYITCPSSIEFEKGDYLMNVNFSHINKRMTIPGYYTGKYVINSDSSIRHTWTTRFTPDQFGIWNYEATLIKNNRSSAVEAQKKGSVYNTGSLKIKPGKNTVKMIREPGFIHYSHEGFLKIHNHEKKYFLTCIAFSADLSDAEISTSIQDQLNQHSSAYNNLPKKNTPTSIPAENYPENEINTHDVFNHHGINSVMLTPLNHNLWEENIAEGNYYTNLLSEWDPIVDSLESLGYVILLEILNSEFFQGEKADKIDSKMKSYIRDVVSKFSHSTGLIWVIGTSGRMDSHDYYIKDFAKFLRSVDPYDHPVLLIWNSREKIPEGYSGYPYIEGIIVENDADNSIKSWFRLKNVSMKKGRNWILMGKENYSHEKAIDKKSFSNKVETNSSTSLMSGGSGLIWCMNDVINLSTMPEINTIFSEVDYSINKTDLVNLPYTTEIINDSLSENVNLGIVVKPDQFIIYTSGLEKCMINSLAPGKYYIKWINLSNPEVDYPKDMISFSTSHPVYFTKPVTGSYDNWLLDIRKIK